MRKPKTPLLSFLQKCFQSAVIAENKGNDFAEEIREKQNVERYNRRRFLTQSLGTVAASGMLLSFAKETNAATLPQIAIIGAGIAGLNAAYHLKKLKGWVRNVKLYEASSDNSWGRIQTKDFGNGITAELGGEFIDSDHTDMLNLADEFFKPARSSWLDLVADGDGFIKDSYFFGGKHYSDKQIINELKSRNVLGKIKSDYVVSEGTNAKNIKKLDDISIEQYLRVNLGLDGWLSDLLNVAYTSEFGLETGEQTSLNFITMIGTDIKSGFKIFGDSDERYKIKGGNNEIIKELKKRLDSQIERGCELKSLRQNNGGKYALTFSNGKEIDADVVVLAVPFSTLRNVDLGKNLFTPEKMKSINELGYGTSSKLLLETKSRVWREQNRSGYLFNEKVQNGWDYSQGQNKNVGKGGYTVFLGGNAGRSLRKNNAEMYVNELNKAFCGFKESHTNSLDINWSEKDLSLGGYACYKVGQWTTIAGEEQKTQGNIFFCGEHCSEDFQGYMNGAAETGRVAAENVIKTFTAKNSPNKKTKRNR